MRKRTATMNPWIENSPAIADPDASGENAAHSALQPQPNPPAKRLRPSRQSDKLSIGSRTAQKAVKPPASKTATASSLPPEIWRSIGQKIPHPQTLRSLVGVSRAFRNIFTPLLYERRIINLEYFSKPLSETPLPPYLEYVQDFRINIYEFRSTGNEYNMGRNDEFALWITSALESMRCLRSFSWLDQSFEDYYGPALIIRNSDLLQALKSARTLGKVCIQFGSHYIEDPVAVRRCYVPLMGFRNLTSLELYDFYGDYDHLVKDIAYVLCDSPLKKLGLGFASDCDDDEAILFGGPGREADFFERLCEFYGSKSRKGPLALETLRLGYGMHLDKPSNATNSHYLTKLLDVKSLEVLHVFNGLINSDLDMNESFYPEIDWAPFESKDCKSLRQLSVTRLEENITGWLRQGGSCVQELIVTDHYAIDDEGLDEFFNLPSRLSMLYTREKHPGEWPRLTDSDWSDTDSSISYSSSSESSDSLSSHLDSSHSDASSPITPKLDRSVMTVLDRLPDGGSHLRRLSIALDFETQWLQFSSHLVNLTRLTQLRLSAKSWRGGKYPTSASSLWTDTNENSEIARRYAHLIGSMCSTLRYIKIGHDLAWEVLRPSTDHVGYRTRSKSSICLRELDKDEILEIELFAITEFAEQSGLPGRERDRVEKEVGKTVSIEDINARLEQAGLPPLPL